ncbi:hypothetical protein [Luteimonas salinilitoris]|uniref:DUF1328 domain-containing protein n=1 Tax=Luteimonas salinilitoris TaxID=3237697 RepID=A0ABV4HVY4_9GAMM
MNKAVAISLVVLGGLLILVSLIALFAAVLPNVSALLAARSAFGFGRLVGSFVAIFLIFLLGVKSLKSGRRRLEVGNAG